MNEPKNQDLWLAYRKKTGCKQYVFYSFSDLWNYFNKKCYLNESIKYTGHRFVTKDKYTTSFIEGELYYVD